MSNHLAFWALATAVAAGQSPGPCTQFTVLTQDKLQNVKPGLSKEDQKWFREKVEKKNPSVCYVDPAPNVSLVFVIIVTPDTYHGTRIVHDTETHDSPVSGTIRDQEGNTADIDGTVKTTTEDGTAKAVTMEEAAREGIAAMKLLS